MRITARQLRQIIKEELSRSMMREADGPNEADAKSAVAELFRAKKAEFPGPASRVKPDAVVQSARSTCKHDLMDAGVAGADIAKYVKKYAPGGDDMGEADMVSKSQ